jgi:hypothetical protein
MALVRALMVFALFWALFALAVTLFVHLTRRQRWALAKLLLVSAAGALLASGFLWAVVALF